MSDKSRPQLSFPCHFQPPSGTDKPIPHVESGTAACGLNCQVCRLHIQGVCSSCGSGTSQAARDKLEAQVRLFGQGCSVLVCATNRQVAYCMRDCDDFPCDVFRSGPFPLSEGFLTMQARRREKAGIEQQAGWPETTPDFWERLDERTPGDVMAASGAIRNQAGGYTLQCLNETWSIDPASRQILKREGAFGGEWDRQVPFLILVYLALARDEALSGELIPPRDLQPGQDFFRGKYSLNTTELEARFGRDKAAFERVGLSLGGRRLDLADAAFRLHVFPRLAVDFLLWTADEEFPARVNLLLDRRLLRHYPFDAAAVALNLLIQRLLATT